MCYRKKKGGCVMQIVGYIKNLDIRLLVALIGFVGVLIGAFISCFTTFCLDWIKFNREEKIYYKRKKEETYISICALIYKLIGSQGNYVNNSNKERFYEQIMNLAVNLEIYASKKVYDLFAKKIIKELNPNTKYNVSDETIRNFINLIKEDLNFKERA